MRLPLRFHALASALAATVHEANKDAVHDDIKAMSKKFRKDVGALGLNSLVSVLKTEYSDTEIISYVLDTLCNVCSPEDWEEEVTKRGE